MVRCYYCQKHVNKGKAIRIYGTQCCVPCFKLAHSDLGQNLGKLRRHQRKKGRKMKRRKLSDSQRKAMRDGGGFACPKARVKRRKKHETE